MSRIELEYVTSTEDQTKTHTLIWKFPDFLDLLEKENKTKVFRTEKSKDSSVNEVTDSRFQLKMQLLGRGNDIIEIYYLSPNPVLLKSILGICLKGYHRNDDIVINKEYHTVQANKWQYLATLFKEKLHQKRSEYMREKLFKLKFQFMVSNDIKVDDLNVPEAPLIDDFENLLNNGLFSDVTMKSAENVEYKVHKAVIASRSAVLKAHFDHDTAECYTNVVESPLESEVLREVLMFIYIDKAPRVDEIPEKLLAAADYYQLSKLKSLCAVALRKKLTVENSLEILQLADLHSTNTLKQLTLEFIKDGQAKRIIKTEGWAKLKSFELIKMIYEYIMTDEIEADIS